MPIPAGPLAPGSLATLPDVLGPVLEFLAADADVTAARTTDVGPPAVKGSIDVRLRAGSVYPFLKVFRVGGPSRDDYLDFPLVQVEAIGAPGDTSTTTDDQVRTLLRTAQAALWLRLRHSTSDGVRFSSVETVTSMQDGFDDATRQLRYLCRLTMAVHTVAD